MLFLSLFNLHYCLIVLLKYKNLQLIKHTVRKVQETLKRKKPSIDSRLLNDKSKGGNACFVENNCFVGFPSKPSTSDSSYTAIVLKKTHV